MSKRQSRKKHPRTGVPCRRKKLLAALTLTITCVVSVTLVAQVITQKKAQKASGDVSVSSFTQPSKEYVYAGSRLIATEEPSTGCTAPPSPTGLNAAAGDAQVILSWNASSGATSYNVKRSTTSGGPFSTISSVSTTTYTDNNGLVNGITYFYVVSAVSGSCESAHTPQVSATSTGSSTDNAGFVMQSVPSNMTTGQIASVSITINNTGTTTWTVGSYFLGSQNPQGNTIWGTSQVALPSSVAPGAQATFNFTVTAPSVAGSYNFQWQMKKTSYFGAFTTNVVINVTAPPSDNASFAGQTLSTAMAVGAGQSVSVSMTNTGTTTWTQGSYLLRSQNPAGNTTWGLSDVSLPVASVAPSTSVTFTFTITAPTTTGDYHFQWQMYKIGGSFFGAQSPDTVITVGSDPPPPAPTLLSATPSGSSITLIWQNNTQSNYIQVERKLGGRSIFGDSVSLAANDDQHCRPFPSTGHLHLSIEVFRWKRHSFALFKRNVGDDRREQPAKSTQQPCCFARHRVVGQSLLD